MCPSKDGDLSPCSFATTSIDYGLALPGSQPSAGRLQNVSMTGVDGKGRWWTPVDDGNRPNSLFQKR